MKLVKNWKKLMKKLKMSRRKRKWKVRGMFIQMKRDRVLAIFAAKLYPINMDYASISQLFTLKMGDLNVKFVASESQINELLIYTWRHIHLSEVIDATSAGAVIRPKEIWVIISKQCTKWWKTLDVTSASKHSKCRQNSRSTVFHSMPVKGRLPALSAKRN